MTYRWAWIAALAALPLAAQSPVAGSWEGRIQKLRIVVKIEPGENGALAGTFVSPDQGNLTLPLDKVTRDGRTLHFELKAAAAAYDGTLDEDGSEIAGAWKQGGSAIPLTLRRPGAAPKTTLKAATRGKVALAPCRTDDGNMEALCGSYEVWENRAARAGRKISLNIMVLPATGPKAEPDPVFALAGGPGGSAVETYSGAGYVPEWRKTRDVVLVDQRGTGKSNILPCAAKDIDDAQSMIGDFYDPERVAACVPELERHADLTQYSTPIFADDLDEVRGAMGYAKINVFGGSYGSRAALVYLRMHPEHIRTVTLQAVAPPEHKLPLAFPKTIQQSAERLFADCAADAACNSAYPNLKSEFEQVLARLEKAPARFEMTNPVTHKKQTVTLSRDVFISDLRLMLYDLGLASRLPMLLHAANQDLWQGFGTLFFSVHRQIEGGIARGMSFSVLCTEDVASITDDEVRRETAGTWLGDAEVRQYRAACKAWPRGKLPANYFAPVRSDVPVLLIGGALDPATPTWAAREAARELKNSRVIEIAHGTHLTGGRCIDLLIAGFVERGSAGALDASCVEQIRRPPFVVPK